jgi:2-polyprenyl-6-methoxyphenol hydroxylase-like FAD-dependent oxidoreductase
MSNRVYPPNSSGIKVIVVGLGYSGVVAAVECFRKGHKVIAFEQTKKVSEGGDMLGIAANAAHIMAAWGDGSVHEEFKKIISVMDTLDLYNWKGEHLTTQSMPGFSQGTGYMGNRREMLQLLCNHAESLDIDIRRGKRITEYFETETEAGVIVDGEKISADCVICCDGVNSKGRVFVLGHEAGKPHPTGYATYRAWFDAAELQNYPETHWLVGQGKDVSVAFIGPDIHCIFGTGKKGKEVVWVCTHLVKLISSLLI